MENSVKNDGDSLEQKLYPGTKKNAMLRWLNEQKSPEGAQLIVSPHVDLTSDIGVTSNEIRPPMAQQLPPCNTLINIASDEESEDRQCPRYLGINKRGGIQKNRSRQSPYRIETCATLIELVGDKIFLGDQCLKVYNEGNPTDDKLDYLTVSTSALREYAEHIAAVTTLSIGTKLKFIRMARNNLK